MSERMEKLKKIGLPCEFMDAIPCLPQDNTYKIVLNEGFICTGCKFKGNEMHLTVEMSKKELG
jgi:hypothetical protein